MGRVKLVRMKIMFYDGTCTPIDVRISRPMYVALISCVWRKRLLKFIDQSSSDGAIGLTGTKNGLTIRLKAKYARVVLQHCVIKQKSFGSKTHGLLQHAASVVNDKVKYCLTIKTSKMMLCSRRPT